MIKPWDYITGIAAAVIVGICVGIYVCGSQPDLSDRSHDLLGRSEQKCNLACECRHLQRDPDPDTWDPVTDSYPRNREWEKCMGVD